MTNLEIGFKVLEIFAMIGAALIFVFGLGRYITKFESSQNIMALEFKTSQTRFEDKQMSMSNDIVDLKADVKKMSEVMIAVALQKQSMDAFNVRMNRQDQHIDDLRKGKGWVTDDKDRRGVDGEYR
jgi:hypothetical protein